MSGSDRHESTLEEVAATLADIDVDGVLQETAADAFPGTRAAFLRRSLSTVAAAGVGGLLVGEAVAAPTTKNDIAILRFDLALEYLQAGLYTEAERVGKLKPETLAWSRVVGAHERAHLKAIQQLLGPRNVLPSPAFNYRGVTSNEQAFIKTAVAFEDLTAALLKWQAPRLDSRSIVAAAVTLHTVETRHAAWIRYLIGLKPATTAFDKPASQEQMARLISSTRFVTSRPRTSRRGRPRFTG